MIKPYKKFFYLAAFEAFLFTGLCAAPSVFAQQAESISTDAFLEYTLADLREKMDAAIENNRQLSSKNDSLQKRMLFLNKESRDFSDEKMSAMEQAVKLRESIKLGANEIETIRKHANNARERKQYLQLEVANLTKQMGFMETERKLLSGKVDDLKVDLMTIREGVRPKEQGSLLQYYTQEKFNFIDMVTQARARVQEKESQVDLLDLDMAKELSLKERELLFQESRKEEVSSLRLKLRDANDKYDLLEKFRRKIQEQSKDSIKDFERGLAELRDYSKELSLVIGQMKDAKGKIGQGFEVQQKTLKDQSGLLQEQNELLFLKKRELESLIALKNKAAVEEHAQALLSDESGQLLERERLIRLEHAKIENDIAAQKKTEESLKRDYDRLKKEVFVSENEVSAAKIKTEQLRKVEFGKKREELKGLLLQKKQNVLKGDEGIKGMETSFKEKEAALKSSRERQGALKERLAALSASFEEAQKFQKGLDEKKQEFSSRVDVVSRETKEDIKVLKLQKKALEGSLGVIEKKYQAGQIQADTQSSEFAQLQGYLSVLKGENASLKKKIMSLQ